MLSRICQETGTNTDFNDKTAVDLKDIKAIIDLMKKNSVSEFELEKQDFKIRLKRGANGGAAASVLTMIRLRWRLAQPPAGDAGRSRRHPSRRARQQRAGDQVADDRHLLPGAVAGIGPVRRGRHRR